MKASPARPPQDWRLLMVLFAVANFLEMMGWGHLLAFTPLYLETELGVSAQQVPPWAGLLASSSLLIALPLSPFWGVLADRYSRKLIIVRTLYVEAAVYALAALSGNVWHFLGVRLLLGFAYGGPGVVMAMQSLFTPDRRTGFALGVISMGQPLGMSLGPVFGSLLIRWVGLRGMFVVDALLAISGALLLTFLLRDPPLRDRSGTVLARVREVLGQVVAMPPVRWNFVAWFLTYSGTMAADPFVPILITRLHPGPDAPMVIGVVLGGYGVLTGLGTPLMGRLGDRIGHARLLVVGVAILSVALLGMSLATTLPVLVAMLLLRALPAAGVPPWLYSHLVESVPRARRSAIMSLTPVPRNVAWLLAPALSGAASGIGLGLVFLLSAVFYALSLPVTTRLLRPASPSSPPVENRG